MQEQESETRTRVSRRTALKVGGAGLAAAVSVEGVRSLVHAQTAQVEVVSTPTIVQNWINAWNSGNPASSLAALYTATGIYEDVPTLKQSQPGNISGFLSSFVNGLSGIHLTLRDAFGTATWAAAEYEFSATNQGTYQGLTGKQFTVRVATIFQLQGTQISRSSDYYNLSTILAQIAPAAATPAPASPGTAPPAPTTAPPAPTTAPTVPATVPPASPTA